MRRATTAPALLSCLLLLAVVDVLARTAGLRRTLRVVRRLAGDGRARLRVDPDLVEATTARLVTAAAFYPRRALCLEQSLALFVLLRRRGIAAEFRLGVQPLPFYAHSWIEVEGSPVNERGGLPLQLATFSNLGV
jgi:transglutaminase-like putative cysteine protease